MMTQTQALATLEREDPDAAGDVKAALAWLTGDDGLGAISLLRLQEFLWYVLPAKWPMTPPAQVGVARALGRVLMLAGLDRYAEVCSAAETGQIITAYANGHEEGIAAYTEAVEASHAAPPDTELLAWGSVMGPRERAAYDACAAALELAFAAGELVAGARGWRTRRMDLVNRWLTDPASVGSHGAGSHDSGSHGAGSHDSGSHDSGPQGADPRDADPRDADQYGASQYSSGQYGAIRDNAGQYGAGQYGAIRDNAGQDGVGQDSDIDSWLSQISAERIDAWARGRAGERSRLARALIPRLLEPPAIPHDPLPTLRWLLDRAGETGQGTGGLRLTARHYIAPALVSEAVDTFGWRDKLIGALRTELDVFPLHTLRTMAQSEMGAVRRSRTSLVLTRTGRLMAADPAIRWHIGTAALIGPDDGPQPDFCAAVREGALLTMLTSGPASYDELTTSLTDMHLLEGWESRGGLASAVRTELYNLRHRLWALHLLGDRSSLLALNDTGVSAALSSLLARALRPRHH